MAIDSMLFCVSIPASTVLTVGQTFPMKVIRGPSVVRDGYGTAIMKRVFSIADGAALPLCHISVKNQNWVDEMANALSAYSVQALANNSPNVQRCGDIELQPNSSFEVNLVVDVASTPSSATDVFVQIDIDYPEIQSVANPKQENGAPVSLYFSKDVVPAVIGTGDSASWTSYNVDLFKAGYRYLLAEMSGRTIGASIVGFFSVSGASGQAGLERIIPFISGTIGAMRFELDYSTPLVKGPMNINYLIMANSATTQATLTELDFIKR